MAFSVPSRVLHSCHPVFEAVVNSQIQLQFHASYVYLSMVFCKRHDVALQHFASFILHGSNEWKALAKKLLELQNRRSSSSIHLQEITKPDLDDWPSGLQAMEFAFHLEKSVNRNLLKLYHLATEREDVHVCHFLQHHCLHQQVLIIRELGSYLTNLRRMGALEDPLAEILFDRLTLGHSDEDN